MYIYMHTHAATEGDTDAPKMVAGPDNPDSPGHVLKPAPTVAQANQAFYRLFDTSWVDAQVAPFLSDSASITMLVRRSRMYA